MSAPKPKPPVTRLTEVAPKPPRLIRGSKAWAVEFEESVLIVTAPTAEDAAQVARDHGMSPIGATEAKLHVYLVTHRGAVQRVLAGDHVHAMRLWVEAYPQFATDAIQVRREPRAPRPSHMTTRPFAGLDKLLG
jgi:hypothetical protein